MNTGTTDITTAVVLSNNKFVNHIPKSIYM